MILNGLGFVSAPLGYTLTQVALVSVAAKRPPGRPKQSQPSDPSALGYQWQVTLEGTAEYEAQCLQTRVFRCFNITHQELLGYKKRNYLSIYTDAFYRECR